MAPVCTRLVVHDEVEALGVLYVTEGASLGAKILVTRARRLGCSDNYGARHLASQAASLASWRRIVDVLETEELDDCARARMLRSSCGTFNLATLCYGGAR